jgi:putative nucleotidyltransferase with HDIG domain
MATSIQQLIAATNELAALPTTTVRLLELLDDPTVGAAPVLEVVEKDPGLTANLLKLCNSAYYGLRRQVGTVREALVMLGNQTVVTLAFAASMGEVLRGSLSGYRLDKSGLWHHTLAVALGASHLASVAGDRKLRERAFTGGMVHDIGKLLLDKELRRQRRTVEPGISREELRTAEREIFGFDHGEAGAALADAWNFPPDLVAVIRYHDRPLATGARAGGGLVAAVGAANLIAAAVGFGGGTGPLPEPELTVALAELGVADAVWRDLAGRLPDDLENLLSIIGERT